MGPTGGRQLSNTEAAILGLLTDGEVSGYDLQKMIRHGVGYFWGPAKSQIYVALPRLVDAGLARARDVPQSSKPDKQLYRITAAGRRALKSWLDTGPVEPPPDRNPILLKLFFGDLAEPDALITQVRERRDAGLRLLADLDELDDRIPPGPDDFFPALTRQWGRLWAEALVQWAEDVEEAIATRARKSGARARRKQR